MIKTTNYSHKTENGIKHNTKIEYYPLVNYQKTTVCNKSIFKDEGWESIDKEFKEKIPKPKNMENEVRNDSVNRAKKNIVNIAMLNQFSYFITWTLDKEKINRFDKLEISKKLKNYLNNMLKRGHIEKYLIIPEYHKDGAIHMHGLIKGNIKIVDSSKKTKDGKPIYNMPQWKLGYSTAIELDEHIDRVAKYITKYVTKDFKKIFGSFYYAGGKELIRKPCISLCDTNYDDVNSLEIFAPAESGLSFKYINQLLSI